jgi:caffeoyl-CoA O-methyltransferase
MTSNLVSVNTVLVDTVLQELEANPDVRHQNWCLAPDAARLVYLLVLMLNAKQVVEVGTSIGYSGLWFLKGLQQTQGHLWTLDVSEERTHIARQHFQTAGMTEHVTVMLGEAKESLQTLCTSHPKAIDILFLDAHKADYVHYFEVAQTLVKAGGLVIADNTVSHEKNMTPFLEAVTHHPDWEWSNMMTENGLLIARRKTKS